MFNFQPFKYIATYVRTYGYASQRYCKRNIAVLVCIRTRTSVNMHVANYLQIQITTSIDVLCTI